MAQPRDYTRQYNFNDFQTTSPSSPLPGNEVDNELNSVKLTLDDLNENIEKIQRDDGQLRNQAVHKDAFDAGALALINADSFNPRGDWATATAYAVNDLVDFNGATYLATTAHTASAAFGTDLNADRWILLANAAIATTAAAVDKYEGDGNTTAFTLQYNYAADTSALVFVNGALRNPGDDYSIVGNQITFTTAPSLPAVAGNENVIVWGASVVAQAAKEAAEAAQSNASGFADEAEAWASQTTGIVESTDYSSKAYAIGGTGVDTGDGSAKDWAIKTSGTIGNTGQYSAKYWATSTDVTTVSSNIGDIQTVSGQITPTNNLGTVAGIAADVTAVAADAADIGVVSSNISDVNSVAGVSADISSLNAIKTDITTVSGIQANVTTVAGISTQTSTVAGIASDVTGVNAISAAVTGVNNISSDVTAVSSNNANVTTVATDLSGSNTIGTVASSISSVNNVSSISAAVSGVDAISGDVSTVSGISANVTTVANNLTDVNNFADTYFIGTTAPASPTNGDLWFDTSSDTMKVYGTSGWQNAGSSVNGTSQRYSYIVGTASGGYTGSTTVFPASYDAGFVDVYRNGIKLVSGASNDFVATNGTSITLNSAATTNDTIDIVAFGTFAVANLTTDDLSDVSTVGVTDGQILQYNAANTQFEPVTFQGGAGYFVGENGTTGNTSTGLGDIFRVHEASLDTAATIPANTNALAAGPLTLNATLTVNGTVTVV